MGEGTIKWKWLDDAGEVHTMIVKKNYTYQIHQYVYYLRNMLIRALEEPPVGKIGSENLLILRVVL